MRSKTSKSNGIHPGSKSFWIKWVSHNLKAGCEVKDLYRIMLDKGVHTEVIREILRYEPRKPLKVTIRKDLESIEPLQAKNIDSIHMVPSRFLEIYCIENFLDKESCQYFEKLAQGRATRSTVFSENPVHEGRTSSTIKFRNYGSISPHIRDLQNRLCIMLGSRQELIESLACQIYTEGQEFLAHQDYFNEKSAAYESVDGEMRRGQRQWSVLIFLRNVEQGSGTRFHRLRMEFTPAQGTALIWNNLYPSGNPNPYSHHSGLPVAAEKKVLLTQMFRYTIDSVEQIAGI